MSQPPPEKHLRFSPGCRKPSCGSYAESWPEEFQAIDCHADNSCWWHYYTDNYYDSECNNIAGLFLNPGYAVDPCWGSLDFLPVESGGYSTYRGPFGPYKVPCWFTVQIDQHSSAEAGGPLNGIYHLALKKGTCNCWGPYPETPVWETPNLCGITITLSVVALWNWTQNLPQLEDDEYIYYNGVDPPSILTSGCQHEQMWGFKLSILAAGMGSATVLYSGRISRIRKLTPTITPPSNSPLCFDVETDGLVYHSLDELMTALESPPSIPFQFIVGELDAYWMGFPSDENWLPATLPSIGGTYDDEANNVSWCAGYHQGPRYIATATAYDKPPAFWEPSGGYFQYVTCCERIDCTSQYVRQVVYEPSTYRQPCCIMATFNNVKPQYSADLNPPTAYYGYPTDLPNGAGETQDLLNPTIHLKRWYCDEAYGSDGWIGQPSSPLNPCPYELKIFGELVEVHGTAGEAPNQYNYVTLGYNYTATFFGTESIIIEDSGEEISRGITFSGEFPGNPYLVGPIPTASDPVNGEGEHFRFCQDRWLGPQLTNAELVEPTLYFDAVYSYDPTKPEYRGPDYRDAWVTLAIDDCTFYECRDDSDCDAIQDVRVWNLEWVSGFGRDESIYLTHTDSNPNSWKHTIWPWELMLDNTVRPLACQMRLLFHCEKFGNAQGFNFGWSWAGNPCDDPPLTQDLWVTDVVPLGFANRTAFLACEIMPGSTISLAPVCTPAPLPASSKCQAEAWRVISDYGTADVSWDSGSQTWTTTDADTSITYTIERIADSEYGEANYRLTMEIDREYTDLVVPASYDDRVTSAAHPFAATVDGFYLNVTGGEDFTTGVRSITSIASATAILDTTIIPDTAGRSGGIGNLCFSGGATTITRTFTTGPWIDCAEANPITLDIDGAATVQAVQATNCDVESWTLTINSVPPVVVTLTRERHYWRYLNLLDDLCVDLVRLTDDRLRLIISPASGNVTTAALYCTITTTGCCDDSPFNATMLDSTGASTSVTVTLEPVGCA